MQKLLIFLFLAHSLSIYSQVIPEERLVDWSHVGHLGTYIEPTNIINFIDEGGIADATAANDLLIQSIISNNTGTETIILFPEGDYLFNQQIRLPSNFIIKGADLSTTKLLFDLELEEDLILIRGTHTHDSLFISNTVIKEDNFVVTMDSVSFQIDDFVYLIDNDAEKITSTWGAHSTGQICQISEIVADTIFFQDQIRRDFLVDDNPVLVKINMVENVGIENLTIERFDQTSSQTSNISIERSYNCWIKCVESINCNFAHFEVSNATNIEISGCYLHDAFNYGSGGKAYGVVLHFATGASLIYNNVFEHLRHSMLLQAGANGNVLSYNYSFDPFWTAVALPANAAGDAVLHGNYPYANLFEGNIIQQIIIDNSHGINGPNNTFFRNRAELYGVFMNNNPPSDAQNFVGNEITNEGGILGLYLLEGVDHFEYGNNQTGTIIPEATEDLTIKSLYLNQSPDFYVSNSNWPPIGPTNPLNEFSNEAKSRFDNGQVTPCSPIVSGLVPIEFQNQLKLFPNPVSQTLFIEADGIPFDQILVRNLLGKKVMNTTSPHLDISFLEDGVYFVELVSKEKPVVISTFVKLRRM